MDRTVLLDEPEVSLAENELVVAGSRYILGEIRSAEVLRVPTAATGPVLMILLGVICLVSAAGGAGWLRAGLGVGLLVGAAAWWTQKKPSFQVSLSMSDGQVTPFESRDERTAARVLSAISEARGLSGGGE